MNKILLLLISLILVSCAGTVQLTVRQDLHQDMFPLDAETTDRASKALNQAFPLNIDLQQRGSVVTVRGKQYVFIGIAQIDRLQGDFSLALLGDLGGTLLALRYQDNAIQSEVFAPVFSDSGLRHQLIEDIQAAYLLAIKPQKELWWGSETYIKAVMVKDKTHRSEYYMSAQDYQLLAQYVYAEGIMVKSILYDYDTDSTYPGTITLENSKGGYSVELETTVK